MDRYSIAHIRPTIKGKEALKAFDDLVSIMPNLKGTRPLRFLPLIDEAYREPEEHYELIRLLNRFFLVTEHNPVGYEAIEAKIPHDCVLPSDGSRCVWGLSVEFGDTILMTDIPEQVTIFGDILTAWY